MCSSPTFLFSCFCRKFVRRYLADAYFFDHAFGKLIFSVHTRLVLHKLGQSIYFFTDIGDELTLSAAYDAFKAVSIGAVDFSLNKLMLAVHLKAHI